MPDSEELIAAFAERLRTRDEPVPLLFDETSVAQRITQALRQRLHQRHRPRLHKLTTVCYRFLAQPTQVSTDPALLAALDCPADTLAEVWRELRLAGLVAYQPAGHRRSYRLTRAGEDWLLAVVRGEAQ